MPAKRIKVLLADDHQLVREGLRTTLGQYPFLKIVGTAKDGADALHKVKDLAPGVVLMDINMPRMNGLEATVKIRQAFPQTKVLIVTVHDSRQYVSTILRSGASGYVTKDISPDELARGIRAVFEGQSFLSPSITRHVLDDYLHAEATPAAQAGNVTERERQILRQLTRGKTNKEIARLLGLSARSVETFRFRLMKKVGVRNAAELTKFALEHALVS
jgi:DNA-binding NarL/FixJ family response regulator